MLGNTVHSCLIAVRQSVAIALVQLAKHQTGEDGERAYGDEGVLKRQLGVLVGERIALLVKAQNQRTQGNAKTHGQLLVDRHQAVATGVLVGAQIGEGDRVHGGELDGVTAAQYEEMQHQQPFRAVWPMQGDADHQHAHQNGVGEQNIAVAKGLQQLLHQRFGQHRRQSHGRNHPARFTG